jgi:PE family
MDMMNAGAIVGAAMDKVARVLSKMPASSGSFTVNKDNVLAAAKIIDAQALSLETTLSDKAVDLRVAAPGEDDVSRRMADAWNDRLVDDEDCYEKRVQQYVDGLKKLVQQLGDTAKAYGHTDEEVAAAIGARSA